MNKIVFIIYCFLSQFLLAQEKSIQPKFIAQKMMIADEFINYDSFGYLYYTKGNVFFKEKENELYQYKNLSLGKINHVDLQNPLKIVLFYEGFNTVVTLDNQLNETSVFNFSNNLNSPIVISAVGLASQNRLWVFNSLTMQLGLFDFSKQIFQPLAQPFQSLIRYYNTDYNRFYWINENQVIFSCDVFGKIETLGKIPNFDDVQFISFEALIYKNDNQLFYFTFKDSKSSLLKLNEKIIEKFRIKDHFLFIFTNNEITKYQINLP
jgi:hypothetical protein